MDVASPVTPQKISRIPQRWTTPAALARYLGTRTETVRRWIAQGQVQAARPETRHYSDERVRLSARRCYRLYEADVIRFLEQLRGGKVSTRGLWRGRRT